jgi:hypothetical protein
MIILKLIKQHDKDVFGPMRDKVAGEWRKLHNE